MGKNGNSTKLFLSNLLKKFIYTVVITDTMYKDIFGNQPHARILDFFSDHPDSEYTITEITEKSKTSRPTVYKVIKTLEKHDIISKRKIGNTPVYKLNINHEVVKAMLQLDFEFAKQIAEKGLKKNEKDFY